MSEENKYHLKELDGSDYEIVDGEPNIIGWDVSDGSGRKVGEVDDLLFDEASRKVRYLIVELDDDYVDIEDDKKVMIPIGLAQLHGKKTNYLNKNTATGLGGEPVIDDSPAAAYVGTGLNEDRDYDLDNYEDDLVVLPNITAAQLLMLPDYDNDNLSYDQEKLVRNVFEGGSVAASGAAATTDFDRNEFYENDYYNEDRFYDAHKVADRDVLSTGNDKSSIPIVEENIEIGKKEVQTGGARLTSRIVERQVRENINLKEEHVTVERNPVDRPVTNADEAFQETEIELTEHAEVPVVNKEARVVEEISLNKEVEETEETIHDTVRKTEVDVEDLSDTDNTTRDLIDEEDDEDEVL